MSTATMTLGQALATARQIVYLTPAEDDGTLESASPRDDQILRSLARRSPILWSDLLRGAIDEGWAIRISPRAQTRKCRRPGPESRLTLAVSENVDRARFEVFPNDERDRLLLLALFSERDQAAALPPPGELFRRALFEGVEVTIRCDVRVIR